MKYEIIALWKIFQIYMKSKMHTYELRAKPIWMRRMIWKHKYTLAKSLTIKSTFLFPLSHEKGIFVELLVHSIEFEVKKPPQNNTLSILFRFEMEKEWNFHCCGKNFSFTFSKNHKKSLMLYGCYFKTISFLLNILL